MKITEFIDAYKSKRFMMTKSGIDEKLEYLKKELSIKTYIPFREKRMIAETIVAQNTKEINGIKKYDSIDGYVGLIVASIVAHTNLEFGEDPVADYDLLAENGLLSQIVAEFQESHNEIDILLKMALASELEDNNINVLIGHFLNNILTRIDMFGNALKDMLGDLDLKALLGSEFNDEDLAKLSSFLNKHVK